jgi:hypothetical protein
MIQRTMVIWLVAIAAVADLAIGGDLQPRREMTKAPVLAQPAYPHRLILKFRDAAKVRSTAQGLASLTGGDLGAIDVIRRAHGAAFSQLIDLPQATLNSLERRAARASGVAQPDLAGMMIVHAPAHRLEQVANELSFHRHRHAPTFLP